MSALLGLDEWLTRPPEAEREGEREEREGQCGGCGEVVPERYLDAAAPHWCTACNAVCMVCGEREGAHSEAQREACGREYDRAEDAAEASKHGRRCGCSPCRERVAEMRGDL